MPSDGGMRRIGLGGQGRSSRGLELTIKGILGPGVANRRMGIFKGLDLRFNSFPLVSLPGKGIG